MDLYIAQPIDRAQYPVGEAPAWAKLADLIPPLIRSLYLGIVAYHPAQAFTVSGGEVGTVVERINRAALAECTGMLAIVPAGISTIGVPREIEAAKAAGIPVAVITDIEGSYSLADVRCWGLDLPGATSAIKWLHRVSVEKAEGAFPALPFLVEANLPSNVHPGDAGFDLYVSEDVVVAPHAFTDVPVGARVALPPGVWARITGRSSTLRKRGLMVVEGIIDTGYRGDLFSGVWNLTSEKVILRAGDRIAQLILHENVSARYRPEAVSAERFDAVGGDSRGVAGFGSTGA